MSELKLLLCPFCGGEARLRYLKPFGWVQCKKCGATSAAVSDYYEETDGKGQAVAAWNRRAQPESSRQHALRTGVCPMCEDCPIEMPNDSRNRQENEPLTLSELREMGGEPVWIQESAPYTFAGYKILCSPVVDEYEDVCFEGGDCYYSHDYGNTWFAYRRKPERSEGK